MKSYIESYIYDVTRRLPKEQRDDVSEELEALIRDMMDDGSNEEQVLKELGRPSELAAKYRIRPRYLISPDQFDQYIATLKMILPILAVIGAVFGFIYGSAEVIIQNNGIISEISSVVSLMSIAIGKAIGFAITFPAYALVWTTIAYAIIDYTQYRKSRKEWTVEELPDVPDGRIKKISRKETIVGLVFSLFFFTLFCVVIVHNFPSIIVFTDNEQLINGINQAHFRQYLPYFIGIFICYLGLTSYKLIKGVWNYSVACFTFLYNIISLIFGFIFIYSGNLLSSELLLYIHEKIPESLSVNIEDILKIIIVMIMIAVSFADTLIAWYRAYRNSKVKSNPDSLL